MLWSSQAAWWRRRRDKKWPVAGAQGPLNLYTIFLPQTLVSMIPARISPNSHYSHPAASVLGCRALWIPGWVEDTEAVDDRLADEPPSWASCLHPDPLLETWG